MDNSLENTLIKKEELLEIENNMKKKKMLVGANISARKKEEERIELFSENS